MSAAAVFSAWLAVAEVRTAASLVSVTVMVTEALVVFAAALLTVKVSVVDLGLDELVVGGIRHEAPPPGGVDRELGASTPASVSLAHEVRLAAIEVSCW